MITRRGLFGAAAGTGMAVGAQQSASLPVEQYEPRSTLRVPEHPVARARYPVIDVHTHLSFSGSLRRDGPPKHAAPPEEVLAVMDRKNLHMLVNLTGGSGKALDQTCCLLAQAASGPLPGLHRALVEPRRPSRTIRSSRPTSSNVPHQRRRARPEGAQDAGPVPARERSPPDRW